MAKVIGQDNRKEATLRSQWREFAKTEAYAELMKYAEVNRDNLLKYAEDMAMPSPDGKGYVSLDDKMSINLLQNRRGIGIITSYIGLYVKQPCIRSR